MNIGRAGCPLFPACTCHGKGFCQRGAGIPTRHLVTRPPLVVELLRRESLLGVDLRRASSSS